MLTFSLSPRMLAAALLPALALSAPLPILPLSTASPGSWPAPLPNGAYYGDIRAVIQLPASPLSSVITAQIFWRRRDPTPVEKAILLQDSDGNSLSLLSADIDSACGLISFATANGSTAAAAYAYYLPYDQGSGGAGTTFSWQGCNDTSPVEGNPCVLGVGVGVCDDVTPAASVVTGLENRDAFNAFTVMEMMATSNETAAAVSELESAGSPFLAVFPTDRDHDIRVFDGGIPAVWAQHTPAPPFFSGAAHPGEYYVFQLGLWAYAGDVPEVTVVAGEGLLGPGGAAIPVTFINTQGVDFNGDAYTRGMSVKSGNVAALWTAVPVPPDAAAGVYSGVITLTSNMSATVSVNVSISVDSNPVPLGGAGNITSKSRLAWLYSTRGLEDSVPQPFTPVTAAVQGSQLLLTCLLKTVTINAFGLPSSIVTTFTTVRRNATVSTQFSVLSSPVAFNLIVAGAPLPATPVTTPSITSLTNSTVTWTATSQVTVAGAAVQVVVVGSLDFTSLLRFNVSVINPTATSASVDDMQLTYTVDPSVLQLLVGLGNSGRLYEDVSWKWSNTTATNKLWLGRAEAGIMVALNGEGAAWDSPMFGVDYPVVPFVPNTWGGAAAAPIGNPYGCSVVNGTVVATSGPRVLAPASGALSYLFTMAATPSKPVNWTSHWGLRTIQVGYGTNYMSPQDVAATGASIVTLHQGTPGVINGSLVNPYINYPFLDDTVPLLTNYTAQAAALGMATKFYYTIRELSTRAVETFVFLSLQGEILLDADPYVIVQPGYAHDWNTHGGSAYLHQHVVTHYAACWQQQLSNGEWDPSACDAGISRLFNYYVEGLSWSMTQPPHIRGIYYDGINFPTIGMKRIRRAANAAVQQAGTGSHAWLDLHTGEDPSPPAVSYAAIYPLMDAVWNGEGFDFSGGSPAYWIVEISSRIHGMTGDMLGGAAGSTQRGMLFGMTERNSAAAQGLWVFFDAYEIQNTVAMGFWEDDVPVNVTASCSQSAAACDAWNVTTDGFYASGSPCGDPNGNIACYPNSTLADAQATCCDNSECAGISAVPLGGGYYSGCFKRTGTCFTQDTGASGYYKPGFVPPPSPNTAVLATVFSEYGRRAIVVIASFCPSATTATLNIDYDALGLPPTVTATAPAIANVQSAQTFPAAAGPYALDVSGGIIIVLE